MLGWWRIITNAYMCNLTLWIHFSRLNSILLIPAGKFGAFFASIPFTIFAAVYCVLFGLVGKFQILFRGASVQALLFFSIYTWQLNLFLFQASVGLSFLQFTNMNSMRNLFITGVALFLGLSIPEYFREYTAKALHGPAHTKAGWVVFHLHFLLNVFRKMIYPIITILTSVSLNCQFNDFMNTIFFSSPTVALIVAVFLDNTLDYKDSARDRGMPWWVKFRTFKGDSRNEEFYTLPFNLNRFFPPS